MGGAQSKRASRSRLALGVPVILGVVVAALVAFHGWVLTLRLAEGRIAEPAVALRWLAGFGLLAALIALRRAGVPLLWGRQALVFWLLVVLLHWSAVPLPDRDVEDLLVVPATVASVAFVAALLAALPSGVPRDLPRWQAGRRPAAPRSGVPCAGFLPPFAARPPPV